MLLIIVRCGFSSTAENWVKYIVCTHKYIYVTKIGFNAFDTIQTDNLLGYQALKRLTLVSPKDLILLLIIECLVASLIFNYPTKYYS